MRERETLMAEMTQDEKYAVIVKTERAAWDKGFKELTDSEFVQLMEMIGEGLFYYSKSTMVSLKKSMTATQFQELKTDQNNLTEKYRKLFRDAKDVASAQIKFLNF